VRACTPATVLDPRQPERSAAPRPVGRCPVTRRRPYASGTGHRIPNVGSRCPRCLATSHTGLVIRAWNGLPGALAWSSTLSGPGHPRPGRRTHRQRLAGHRAARQHLRVRLRLHLRQRHQPAHLRTDDQREKEQGLPPQARWRRCAAPSDSPGLRTACCRPGCPRLHGRSQRAAARRSKAFWTPMTVIAPQSPQTRSSPARPAATPSGLRPSAADAL
jgi:hypothetical protein